MVVTYRNDIIYYVHDIIIGWDYSICILHPTFHHLIGMTMTTNQSSFLCDNKTFARYSLPPISVPWFFFGKILGVQNPIASNFGNNVST